MTTTGIPNHDLESGPGCCASEQQFTWHIPLQPVNDSSAELTAAPLRGPIAVAVNGVPIYGPEDGPGGDAVASMFGAYREERQQIWLGVCMAHSGPGGSYHYHADGNCIHWHPHGGQTWKDYSFESMPTTEASPLIGFAFDGYPIYGTYALGDDGEISAMTSSYRLKEGKTGSGGIADYDHVPGLGHLDECNGRWAPTPDFPNGTYAYHSTRHNGEGGIGFPYFLNCYRGVVDATNFDTGGDAPAGNGPPPGGRRPPPP